MARQFAHTEIHDRLEFLRLVNRGSDLQPGNVVSIEFLPERPGEYGPAFPMGFRPGKLTAEQEV